MTPVPPKVEIAPNVGLSGELAEQVLEFWAAHGALGGAAAEQRLTEVVCVLLGDGGGLYGVSSVVEREVVLIGHRHFWMYRRFLDPDHAVEWEAPMFCATFGALEQRFVSSGSSGPIGLCRLIRDQETIRRHPEAVWPETELVHADTCLTAVRCGSATSKGRRSRERQRLHHGRTAP